LGRILNRRAAASFALFVMALVLWGISELGSVLVVGVPIAHPDAIISLASHEWERLPLAARLATAYPTALLLLTVPEQVTPYNCHDCANRTARLRRLGVDESRVRLLQLSAPGTYGEALAASTFARRMGIRSMIVATSPYHTRRALAVFRKVFDESGIRIGVEPATTTSPASPGWWWAYGYDRAYVAYEWAAIGYYGWHYGVGPTEYSSN